MKYAHIDENNMLIGYYDDQLHDVIPTPNVELTEEQWQACIDANVNKVNADGTGEKVDTRTAEEISKEYQWKRATEYPSVEDYLDAIVKGDEAQKQAYIDACLAVKAKYPKPE